MKKTTPLLNLTFLGIILPALAAPPPPQPDRLPGQHPRPGIGDPRIRNLTYGAGQVYAITTNYYITTAIHFSQDEYLLPRPIIGGDPLAWDVHVIGPSAITVKPIAKSPDTNMIVHTDKRVYYFHLSIASEHSTTKAVYGVHFSYPMEEAMRQRVQKETAEASKRDPNTALIRRQQDILRNSIALNNIYTGYTMKGSKTIKPNTVFDDGRFTYLRFDAHRPVPSIYAKDPTGESLVNHHVRQNYLIVQRLANEFILRLNRSKLHIKRNQPTGTLRSNEPSVYTPIIEQKPYSIAAQTTGIGMILPRPAIRSRQQKIDDHTRSVIETNAVKRLPPTPYEEGLPERTIVTPDTQMESIKIQTQQSPVSDITPSQRTTTDSSEPLTDAFIRFTGAAPDMPCPGGEWINTPNPDQPGQTQFVLKCP